ncbi:hypothetical protein BELL_1203g00030 [Botrytis elliptica]|uniref:Cyclic nucleotide-binding domain-containing protein n=1 Tax=Botrytis elliptica TaxID=278938 RepID=A0A4Z1ILT4_9HELO|nr:hypothetical protein BELL_1203g00030 [Botrytis elliptica]
MSGHKFENEKIGYMWDTTPLHFAALLSLDRVCVWLVENSEFRVNVNRFSGIGTPLACTLAPQLMLGRDQSLYVDHPGVNNNTCKVLKCLLKSGLVINNVRIDPWRDWSPLAMAVNADIGWDILLKEGAIIDNTCMTELEKIGHEETKLVRRFVENVTEINISADVKSRFTKLALEQKDTGLPVLELISKSNDMIDVIGREVALQKASLFGQIGVVKDVLAQSDLDINFCGPETQGLTALHSASINGQIDVVRLLIDHGAALDLKDSKLSYLRGFRHLTAFMLAVINGQKEVAMMLENSGADINALDDHGHSTLHMAAICSVSVLEYILHSPRFHQTVSVRSTANATVLMMAVISGDKNIVEYVLKRSSLSDVLARCTFPNYSDPHNGYTALHFSVHYNSPRSIIEVLIQSGLEMSLQTELGDTPLHIAAAHGKLGLFRVLMSFTEQEVFLTPLSARDPFKYTSIVDRAAYIQDTASKWYSPSIYPSDYPTEPWSSVLLSIIHGRWVSRHEMFQALQMYLSMPGINLEPKDAEGRSPLVVLCQELSKPDDPDRWDSWIALHSSIDLLIRRGAEILSQDAVGNTTIHYICEVASIPHHFGALLILLYESTPILLCSKPNEHSIESYYYTTLEAELYEGSPLISNLSNKLNLPLELQRRQSSGKFSNSALLNIINNDNQTALHVIFEMLDVKPYSSSIERFALELLKLATKEDVNNVLPDGRSLLNISFNNGYDALSQRLVDMDIDVRACKEIDGEDFSPLELLCTYSSENQELIRSMISRLRPEELYESRDDFLIHTACSLGSIAVTEEFLSAGWSTETTNEIGCTPIISAIEGGQESTVELLLAHGAHLSNVMYKFGELDQPYNPLEFARTATMCQLIDSKGLIDWSPEALEDREEFFKGGWVPGITSDPNEPNSYSGTWDSKAISSISVLHVAAYKGNIEALEFGIVQKHLKVDAQASLGLTPLFFAIFGDEESVVKMLLQHGADANECYGPVKVTPLHVAVAAENVFVIEMLISHGADPQFANRDGWTPYMVARLNYKDDIMVEALENSPSSLLSSSKNLTLILAELYLAPLEKVVEKGEDTFGTDNRIHIGLEKAILCNDVEMVNALPKNGWSPESTCSCGCTILLTVLHDGLLELADYFIDAGVTVKGAIMESRAATTITELFPPGLPPRGSIVVETLKSKQSLEGSTSLDLATGFGDSKLVQKILNRSQPSSPQILRALHTAVLNYHTGCVRILLHRLAVQSRNKNCLEAEHTVITHPEYLSAPLLFSEHNGGLRVRHEPLATALNLAANCSNDSFRVINELLSHGADLEARDQYGDTALHHALFNGSLKAAMILVFAGANVSSISGKKRSPIQLSLAYCTPNIVSLLHKFGASLETDMYSRGDLLSVAIQRSSPEMVHALMKLGVNLNTEDQTGVPVLLTALKYLEEDFILELLPEIDDIRHKKLGTMLNQASAQSLSKIISVLLSREFKIPGDINEYVNHAGEDGAPLYLAAIGKKINTRVECMELLIHHGAEIDLVSGPQGTPLMAACYHGAYDSVVYLLKHGASTTCKKRDGIEATAMQAAYLHKDIMLLLQSFQDNGPKALEEPRTVMNANVPMLEWCMLRLENNEKESERETHLSLFEEASSQPWWTEDIDTHED